MIDVDGEMMLSEIMAYLQDKEEMRFVEKGGMIASINGKDNPADFSRNILAETTDVEKDGTISH